MNISPNDYQQIAEIIRAHHLKFALNIVGPDYLSSQEKDVLKKFFGEDVLNLDDLPYLDKIFLLGQLSTTIGDASLLSLSYKDFLEFLKKKQYNADHVKGKINKEKVDKYKKQAYLDILNSQAQITRETRQNLLNVEDNNKKDTLSVFGESLKENLPRWNDNLNSSIAYTSQGVFEQGKADKIESEKGDSLVYKQPLPGACPQCIKHYLTAGEGSRPRIFKLSELVANGTNVGKKAVDWKPVLGPMHPHCRCLLKYLPENVEWDEERGVFVPKLVEGQKVERKSKVKVYVGNRVFEV